MKADTGKAALPTLNTTMQPTLLRAGSKTKVCRRRIVPQTQQSQRDRDRKLQRRVLRTYLGEETMAKAAKKLTFNGSRQRNSVTSLPSLAKGHKKQRLNKSTRGSLPPV